MDLPQNELGHILHTPGKKKKNKNKLTTTPINLIITAKCMFSFFSTTNINV